MIKKIFKRLYNLNIVLILVLFIAGVITCTVFTYGAKYVYISACEDKIGSDISAYASRISSQLVLTDYIKSTNLTIDDELSVAAELYDGRVLVVNNSYDVVYDSFQRATGKTVVLNEIITTISDGDYISFNWDSKFGTYCYRVGDENNIYGAIMFVFSIQQEAETLTNILENFGIVTAIVLIVLVLFGFVFGQVATRSVRRMRAPLKKLSNGDFTAKLDEKGLWEFRNISTSVNEAIEKVKSTEESQQEFVSNVSHELKTPMTSMKVLADSLLMMQGADEETYREFLTDINEQIDRENEIIEDLLTLVRLDKKSDNLNISLCSMNDIMSLVLKRVIPLAEKSHIEIMYESYREISAEVDDRKLVVALTNFVENAVKYNNEFGQVRVGLNSDARYVYITVEDNGIGISEEAQKHIFDRFYRVDKARARETGGSGLGLSIAHEIIAMHNGEIKVYSAEGEGTTFNIRIPLIAVKKAKVLNEKN